ncbi:hypothetical protein [Fulvimonas yonginensis]|uniref:Uncharacterized protein n=1 Tax=Fulvimonas yonginensis TaxID=1495200 RepID=A0ABU8JGD6_9GAMM
MLGHDDAAKMARAFSGETLWLALGHGVYLRFRDTAVRRMLAHGARVDHTAWLFDLTPRQVQTIRATD